MPSTPILYFTFFCISSALVHLLRAIQRRRCKPRVWWHEHTHGGLTGSASPPHDTPDMRRTKCTNHLPAAGETHCFQPHVNYFWNIHGHMWGVTFNVRKWHVSFSIIQCQLASNTVRWNDTLFKKCCFQFLSKVNDILKHSTEFHNTRLNN